MPFYNVCKISKEDSIMAVQFFKIICTYLANNDAECLEKGTQVKAVSVCIVIFK